MPVNVKILIQAVDQASKVMQKVTGSVKQAETQMKSLGNISRNTGNTIQTGMDKSANGIKKAESATKNLQGSLNATARTASTVGSTGSRAFNEIGNNATAAGSKITNAGRSLTGIRTELNSTSATGSSTFSRLSSAASSAFSRMGSVARSTFASIRSGISTLAEAFSGLEGAIGGVIGSFGALQMATTAMGGAMNRELTQAWMTTKVGAKTAAEYQKVINEINMISPAPSSFINQLMTGAVARQTNLSASALRTLGQAASDYFVASQAMGKSAIETQMDLIEYIQTGNTSQLERDSILKNQIDKLKDQATVEARIKALNDALVKEGYKGISQLDSAKIKFEEFKGRIEEALIMLGSRVLPVISNILETFNRIDNASHGWLSTIIVAVGGVIALGSALGMAATMMSPLFKLGDSLAGAVIEGKSLRDVLAGTSILPTNIATAFGKLKEAIMSTSVAQALFNNISKEGLIVQKESVIATALATAKNIIYTAATNLAAAAQAVFNAIMSANPIYLVAMAIGVLIAAMIYLWNTNEGFRKALTGLWEQLKGFAGWIWSGLVAAWNSLKAALQPVIDAFRTLGGVISGALSGALSYLGSLLSGAGAGLMSFLKPIGDVIVKFGQLVYFFMFTSEGAAKLTNQFGVLGFALAYLINPVRTIIWAFQQLKLAWDQWAKSAEGQKVLGELNNAFKEVQSAFKAVWDALKPLGDAFRELWSSLTQTSNSAQKASSGVKKAGDSAGGAASPVQIFVEAIKILAWILENVVIPAIKILAEIIRIVASVISVIVSIILIAVNVFMQIAGAVAAFIGVLQAAWSILSSFGATVMNSMITAGQAIWNFVTSIVTFPFRVLSLFWQVLTGQISWSQMVQKLMGDTGMKMVRAIIAWLQQLPGKMWSLFLSGLAKIVSFASQALSKAIRVGTNIVKGVIDYVKQLPSKVWYELMRIGDKIMQAGGVLYQKACELGQKILDGVLGVLGIRSPGFIYKETSEEFDRVVDYITKIKTKAGDAASEFANSIKSNAQVELPQPTLPQAPTQAPNIEKQATTAISGAINTNIGKVSEQLDTIVNETNTKMDEWVKIHRNTMETNKQVMNTGLKAITEANTKAQTQNKNILKTATDAMVKTTKSGMENMKSSWNDMKNKVVAAAERTKSGVTSHINTLSANIRRFYNLVRNPGAGGPAGGPTSCRTCGPSLRRIVPSGLGFGALPSALTPTDGREITIPAPGNLHRSIRDLRIVSELGKYFKRPDKGFGGWDYSPQWIKWIEKQIDAYKVTFIPGLTLNAGDFSQWPPKGLAGNLVAFMAMMAAIIGRTHYAFYYGSSGLSPAALLARGAFNCYDGARVVCAYASLFGLPCGISCGLSWAGIPHCAARVAGVWMDTTAFQAGYGWTSPKVSGYGGPTSSFSLEDLVKGKSSNVAVSLDHRVDVNLSVKGEGKIDKVTVEKVIRESGFTGELKRELLEDETFRSRLLKVIGDAISREERYYGI